MVRDAGDDESGDAGHIKRSARRGGIVSRKVIECTVPETRVYCPRNPKKSD
jgi:hypothetical protein